MKLIAQIVAGSALSLLVVGCAGSGSSVGGSVAPNPYAGSYTSAPTLDGGKRGTLALTVAADGKATGTMSVAAPRTLAVTPAGPFSFTIGTMTVNGTVGNDGTLNITGTDPTSGGFSIGGQLGLGSANGSITVAAGGETWTSAIGISSGGGSASLTYSGVTGANVNSSAWPSNPFVLRSDVAGSTAAVASPSATDNSRAISFNVGAAVKPGDSVTLNGANGLNATVLYQEGAKTWIANGGTLKLVARSATTLRIELVNANFAADASTPATGTFKLSGTIAK